MARSGDTEIVFNEPYFEKVLRASKVEALVDETAGRVQAVAKSTAPVDSGDYRDGIVIQHKQSRYRRVTRVVGTDEKTMIIESKTGNMARAVKAAKA